MIIILVGNGYLYALAGELIEIIICSGVLKKRDSGINFA